MRTTPRGTPYLAVAILLAAAACGRPKQPSTPTPTDSVEVGYGAQPKDKVMGAVTSLGEKDFNVRPLRIEQILRGRVAGLQIVPGPNGPSFRIRGASNSMIADQEPLFIVDGVQIPDGAVNSTLAGLMPDDIKSVSVLKDIASTSIYGGRGAGGVILIATKK